MSDQDFFFDDDETTPAKAEPKPAKAAKAAAKPATKPATVKSAAAKSAPAVAPEPQDFLSQTVPMSIASLLAVCALLVGVIVGVLLPVGGGSTGSGSSAVLPGGSLSPAPQLSQEQISQGQLPAGHPNIGGGSTAATAAK